MTGVLPHAALVAHRGQAATCPENTLEALEAAIAAGARFVEVDVQMSADGVPFLFHDESLERTASRPEAIHAMTSDEVAAVDLPGASGVPRLTAALGLLANHAHVTAFIEIKCESVRALGDDSVDGILDVMEADGSARHPVISFDPSIIGRARARLGCPIGLILPDASDVTHAACAALGPEFIFCDVDRLPDVLWDGRWQWAVYEVIDADVARALAARGAAFVETMDYVRMSRALGW